MDTQKLAIVLEVDTAKGEASIRRINSGLDSMGRAAAAAGQAGRRGIDAMSDAMTAGALKAGLLLRGLEKTLELAKQWTVEAAQYAARTETLGIVTERLALANGLSVGAINRQVEAVKKLGITTQESRNTVNQMIVAQLDVAKATQLARMAQDAAVVAGVNSSEALGTIIAGIVEQRVQMLRTMGISISFEQAFRRQAAVMGKTVDQLTEYDKKQIALNTVLAKAPDLAGAYEAAMGTAGKQMTSLSRHIDEAKNALGQAFLPALQTVVSTLTGAAKHVQAHAEVYAALAKAIAIATAAALAFKAASFLAAPPWLAAAAAAAGALAAAFVLLRDKTAVQRDAINDHIADLKKERDELDHAGLSAKEYADQLDRIHRAEFRADMDLARNEADARRAEAERLRRGVPEAGVIAAGAMTPGAIGPTPARPEEYSAGGVPYGTYESRYNHKGKDGLTHSERARRQAEEEQRAAEAERLAVQDRRAAAEQMKSAESMLAQAVEHRQQAQANADRARAESVMQELQHTSNAGRAALLQIDILDARLKEYAGTRQRIETEEARIIRERSTRVDEKTGRTRTVQLPAAELELIHRATAEKMRAAEISFNTEMEKVVDEMWKAAGARNREATRKYFIQPLIDRVNATVVGNEIRDRGADQAATFARQAIDQRRDYELAQLGTIQAHTVQQQLEVEARKTQIEMDAARARTAIEIAEIDRRAEHERAAAVRALHEKGTYSEAAEKAVTAEVDKNAEAERAAARNALDAHIRTDQVRLAAEQARTVQDHYRRVFDSLKQQAGGVFDALLTKSRSVWQAMGDALKTALLTAIKEVVTSRIAAALMQMFTGVRTTFQGGGPGGFGASPVFGGGGALAGAAAVGLLGPGGAIAAPAATPPFVGGGPAPVVGGLGGFLGGGGGITTPPFVGGATGGAGGATASAGGGILSNAAQSAGGLWANMKGSLAQLGNIGWKPSRWSMDENGDLTKIAGARGVGGWKGGAMLAGGSMLLMDGLRRGGKLGVAESAGGGALIGAKFGGPIGALIGGIAGFAAGMIRLAIKTQREKVKDQVAALYHIQIDDKMAEQIIGLAKSNYNGNVDMAIRSRQVIDLLQLYAEASGQSFGALNIVRAASLVQSGGSVRQAGTYENGALVGLQSYLPSMTGFDRTLAAGGYNSGPMAVTLSLDGRSSAAFLQGQTVSAMASNPGAVSSAAADGFSGSFGRTAATSSLISPGTLAR